MSVARKFQHHSWIIFFDAFEERPKFHPSCSGQFAYAKWRIDVGQSALIYWGVQKISQVETKQWRVEAK